MDSSHVGGDIEVLSRDPVVCDQDGIRSIRAFLSSMIAAHDLCLASPR
jgi:hypothetical protein